MVDFKEIAKLLNVTIGQKFQIDYSDITPGTYYSLLEDGLYFYNTIRKEKCYRALADLLYGDRKIIPALDEPYYFVCWKNDHVPYVEDSIWRDDEIDYERLVNGNVFLTHSLAEKDLKSIYKKLVGASVTPRLKPGACESPD